MALPLGKKSLIQIQRRQDPTRRIVDLAILLEWMLRLEPPSTSRLGRRPTLQAVVVAFADSKSAASLAAAINVRDRLVHCVPGIILPTAKEIAAASNTLLQALTHLLDSRQERFEERQRVSASWQAANDPLGEMGEIEESSESQTPESDHDYSGQATALRERVRTALWRLDIVSGWRAPFTVESLTPAGTETRLKRHGRHLTTVGLTEVQAALESESSSSSKILADAATSLEQALSAILAFDALWQTAPGVLPLPAIMLEPDMLTRVRHLTTLVEHLLAWIVPRMPEDRALSLLQEESGKLLEELLELNGHLLPDPEEVSRAVSVRDRLVRIIADEPPVLSFEAQQAERVLWQAAYELRRHADLEHADAISLYEEAPLRTVPRSQMWSITNQASRLSEQIARARALAMVWEGRNPGGWTVPGPEHRVPLISSLLNRHPWNEIHQSFEDLDAAERAVEQGFDRVRDSLTHKRSANWEQSITRVIHLLEEEFSWLDRPRPLAAAADLPPVIQPSLRQVPQPVVSRPVPSEPTADQRPLEERFPVGTTVQGIVANLPNYGAFIQLDPEVRGLLHISDMSWRRLNHPSEMVQEGQEIECIVLAVDMERKRISLGLKQLQPDPWTADYPNRFAKGKKVRGTVVRLADFGFFVQLDPGLEGLVHISQISDQHVDRVSDFVKVGQQIDVVVLNVDPSRRKIGLSYRDAQSAAAATTKRATSNTPRPSASKNPPQKPKLTPTSTTAVKAPAVQTLPAPASNVVVRAMKWFFK